MSGWVAYNSWRRERAVKQPAQEWVKSKRLVTNPSHNESVCVLKMLCIRGSSWVCVGHSWNCLSWVTAPWINNYIEAAEWEFLFKQNFNCCSWWAFRDTQTYMRVLEIRVLLYFVLQQSKRQASRLVKVSQWDTTPLVITCLDDSSKELPACWCQQMKSWLVQINH